MIMIRSAAALAATASLLIGCTSVQEAIRDVSQAAAGVFGPPAEVTGTYRLTLWDGAGLPVAFDQMIGSPCPGGGRIRYAWMPEAEVTLDRTYGARLSGDVHMNCDMPSGENSSQRLSQDLRASYTVRGDTIMLVAGEDPPQRFLLDRSNGRLASADRQTVYQRRFTRADALVPERAEQVSAYVLQRSNREGALSDEPAGARAASEFAPLSISLIDDIWIAVQPGNGTDAPQGPLLSRGADVDVVLGAATIPSRVVHQIRLTSEPDPHCGGPAPSNGFLYILDLDRSPSPDEEGYQVSWAFPSDLARRYPEPLPEPVRAGFGPAFRRDLDAVYHHRVQENEFYGRSLDEVRRSVYGSTGDGGVDALMAARLRTPQGERYWVTVTLDDDPSEKGGMTRRTYILDASGRVLLRFDETYHPVTVLDLDGDGFDELVTATGTAYFSGGEWVLPRADEFLMC
jgi:hypothetical protein